MGIRDRLVAYWFDDAICLFGTVVDHRLDQQDKDGKRKYSLEQALGLQPLVTSLTALMLASGQDEING